MGWMASWLKELILMILLATFAEMLLPKSSLHRYVKTVLGLFILMAMLSPIFTLLQKQKEMDHMLASASAAMEGSVQGRANGTLYSLSHILQEGERIKKTNEQDSKMMVEATITSLLNQEALAGEPLEASKVSVMLEENNGETYIRHVRVLLHAIDLPEESQPAPSGGWRFEPVAPVYVSIGPDRNKRNEAGGQSGNAGEAGGKAEDQQAVMRVKQVLKERLQLNDKQIAIEVEAKSK
jgi:stage III sporulation protein AF